MEPNQVDIFASTVLGDLEQIDETKETRLARQLWSDIGKTDRLDRIHLDLTFFHPVPRTHFDMGTHPYSDAASDFSATNSLAKPLGEHHAQSLHAAEESQGLLTNRNTPPCVCTPPMDACTATAPVGTVAGS